ncbi:MAG: hypothetical protein PVJ21_08975 [Anaerolineales bacterium]|jgi:hypothetical protein
MKKLLSIGLILLTACSETILEPTATLQPTHTRVIPTNEPATVTPTIIPIPTMTATPPPPERYFTEEFDGGLGYWSTLYASGDSERVEVLNEDSKLTFEIYSPVTWMYAIYGPFEYEQVYIETRVESLGSQTNSMGLVCHYDEGEGWYEFNISNDGSYHVLYGQWLAEGIATYMPILEDSSKRIITGNSVNEIGLGCYEDTVQLYINGELIRNLNVAHIGLKGGNVGLSLGSFEDVPVILSFDWVKVNEP